MIENICGEGGMINKGTQEKEDVKGSKSVRKERREVERGRMNGGRDPC